MIQLIPIPILLVAVWLLVRAEFRDDRYMIVWLKPACTLLVILIATLSFWAPSRDVEYCIGILLALFLSLIGDIALMFTSRRAFLVGLVGFLLAHVVYLVLFWRYSGWTPADLLSAILLLGGALLVLRYLWPGLDRLRVPVIIYIGVICLMVNRALGALFLGVLSANQAWMIATGAVFFWISDLMLGIHRFGRPFAWNRTSLIFYYAGQTSLALSASFFV